MTQSNIIALNVHNQRQSLPMRLALHAELFANQRRSEDDVFWLKENAEFLNIVEATGLRDDSILDVYAPVYASVDRRLGDYPQYYRFLLSICLDLEDLGMPGSKGAALCEWVQKQGLVEAELSDLQRAEADRLLARRGVARPADDVRDRLLRFIGRAPTFAIPNKKAAYELTHIVFYLSEYGRRDPQLPESAILSLHYAGLQAYLDQNFDLLAEICIALRYAGHAPCEIWETAVSAAVGAAQAAKPSMRPDDYHAYLVSTWMTTLRDKIPMGLRLQPIHNRIEMPQPHARPLRDLSFFLQETRRSDWMSVRSDFMRRLDADATDIVEAAERSSPEFAAFFELFARAQAPCEVVLQAV